MTTVLGEILESFFEALSKSEAIDEETLEALRALFKSGKKLKPDDIVAILSGATGETPS